MRMRNAVRSLIAITCSGLSPAAPAVTMDWTFVGDPENPCDFQFQQGCFGQVDYPYYIGTYEVTNAQYAEFLNAKATSDSSGLYPPGTVEYSGITRAGIDGSYTYSVVPGREDLPVGFVSFFSAARFTNWLNNGQGSGDTLTGAYTLSSGDPYSVTRNAGATIVLPNEDEWYKAAYYSSSAASYFDYPTGSNTQTVCAPPTATPNRANCGFQVNGLTPVGSYTGSASPFGTFDQGGNVIEWIETIVPTGRVIRGGAWLPLGADDLAASTRWTASPYLDEADWIGFRVAMIPEPSTGLLVMLSMLSLAGWRRLH